MFFKKSLIAAIKSNRITFFQCLLLDFLVISALIYWLMTTYPAVNAMYLYEFFMVLVVCWLSVRKLEERFSDFNRGKIALYILQFGWMVALYAFIFLVLIYNVFTVFAEQFLVSVNRMLIESVYMLIFIASEIVFFIGLIKLVAVELEQS